MVKIGLPSVPTEAMISTLKGLCEDKGIRYLLSAERASLTRRHLVIFLISVWQRNMECSFRGRPARSRRGADGRLWFQKRIEPSVLAISIMEVYTSRTHGSYIEETEGLVAVPRCGLGIWISASQSSRTTFHISELPAVDILHGGIEGAVTSSSTGGLKDAGYACD
jgi:trehalose 6-phosphate synthase/phosphatase